MDADHLDALSRSLSAPPSRRAALRVLAGSLLGGLVCSSPGIPRPTTRGSGAKRNRASRRRGASRRRKNMRGGTPRNAVTPRALPHRIACPMAAAPLPARLLRPSAPHRRASAVIPARRDRGTAPLAIRSVKLIPAAKAPRSAHAVSNARSATALPAACRFAPAKQGKGRRPETATAMSRTSGRSQAA